MIFLPALLIPHLCAIDTSYLSESFFVINDNDTTLCQDTCGNISKARISELLFYESILPLETFLFLIEVLNISEGGIDTIFKDVIEPITKIMYSKKLVGECLQKKNTFIEINPNLELNTKTEILKLLDIFSNFSTKLSAKDDSLTRALQKRNRLFSEDVSQISIKLYRENLKALKQIVENLKNSELVELLDIKEMNKKNTKYAKLVKALRRVIIETENLAKAINRELREFVYEFSSKVSVPKTKDFIDTKMLFNLGATIFAPNIFLQMARDIFTVDRDYLLEKAVKNILAPLLKLKEYIRYKSNVEKKEEIVKFTLACLSNKNSMFYDEIDDAFKARSMILNLYFKNEDVNIAEKMLKQIDQYQERFADNLKRKVVKMKEDVLANFITVNDDIIQSYTDLVRNGTKENETKLMKIFANKL